MKDRDYLLKENEELKARLAEAEELLAAIKSGAVDAFVADNQKVFTLMSADHDYRVLVETMNEGAATLTLDGAVMYCNSRLAEMFGLPIEKIIGGSIVDFVASDELSRIKAVLRQSKTETTRAEFRIKKKDGTTLPVLVACSSFKLDHVGLCMVITDLTEQKKSEDSLKSSLREKEVMLMEIHHRVKNNLQIISSLLRLQAGTIEDKKTASLFMDSQARVRAMAMVHEFLYKSPDISRINFQAYVASLVRNLYRTFGVMSSENPPTVSVDDVFLSLDVAVPCGLIFTELISNTVKYAYPGKKPGPVDVCFKKKPDGVFELSVADKGVGFPAGFDWTKSNSLGLRLVNLLTEQLHGEVRMENHKGIKLIVTFKEPVL